MTLGCEFEHSVSLLHICVTHSVLINMIIPRRWQRERERRRRLEIKEGTDSLLHTTTTYDSERNTGKWFLTLQVSMRLCDFRVMLVSHVGILVRSDCGSIMPGSHCTSSRGQGVACTSLQCLTSSLYTESFLNVSSWWWVKKSRLE